MRTFDIKNYDVIVGDNLITGFGEGTSIEVSPEGPGFTDKVGIDGEATSSRSHDRRATLSITLMASSESNDVLSAIYAGDRAGVNGEGVLSVSIVNREGTDEYSASQARIMQEPDLALGAEVGENVWQIRMFDYSPAHGSIPSL